MERTRAESIPCSSHGNASRRIRADCPGRIRPTAELAENSATIRARISERLAWLGVVLDPAENTQHAGKISRSDSRIPVYVVPTDEELMIAQHTLALLMKRQTPNPKRETVS